MAKFIRPFAGDDAEVAAQRLVERFGSPSRLLCAPDFAILEALKDRPTLGAHLIAARAFADFAARATVIGEPVDPRSGEFCRYLVATLGMRANETVLAVYLDGNHAFLTSEIITIGLERSADFPTRLLIARALEVGARGIVLAHNHPSGFAFPSEHDHGATDHIRAVTASLEIELLDHLIVGRGQIFSMARGAPL